MTGSCAKRTTGVDVKLPFAMTAIPLLLERLQLTGALVTIDGSGPRPTSLNGSSPAAATICSALKANRPVLHQDVVDFFANPTAGMTEPGCHTTDGNHGRIEERKPCCLPQGRLALLGPPLRRRTAYPDLAMIGMVESRVERNGSDHSSPFCAALASVPFWSASKEERQNRVTSVCANSATRCSGMRPITR